MREELYCVCVCVCLCMCVYVCVCVCVCVCVFDKMTPACGKQPAWLLIDPIRLWAADVFGCVVAAAPPAASWAPQPCDPDRSLLVLPGVERVCLCVSMCVCMRVSLWLNF